MCYSPLLCWTHSINSKQLDIVKKGLKNAVDWQRYSVVTVCLLQYFVSMIIWHIFIPSALFVPKYTIQQPSIDGCVLCVPVGLCFNYFLGCFVVFLFIIVFISLCRLLLSGTFSPKESMYISRGYELLKPIEKTTINSHYYLIRINDSIVLTPR